MSKGITIEVQNSSGLTDADWFEVGKMQKAYAEGGMDALNAALNALLDRDAFCHAAVCGAFWPDELREAINDSVVEQGMDEEDVLELMRNLENPDP